VFSTICVNSSREIDEAFPHHHRRISRDRRRKGARGPQERAGAAEIPLPAAGLDARPIPCRVERSGLVESRFQAAAITDSAACHSGTGRERRAVRHAASAAGPGLSLKISVRRSETTARAVAEDPLTTGPPLGIAASRTFEARAFTLILCFL